MGIEMKTVTKIHTLPPELPESSLFLLKRLGFAAKSRAIDEYERLGLNPYHHAILALLDGSAPETQAEIADALGYDRGTMVGLLDELEARGLIER
ncbi:MAG TPA: helix-turn-helix domain-containing protein, partial [Gaiellaceae bacterium]|nr:helix-turn-helix domain-containing protein [Gaiellaceae bacterium]